MKYRPGSSATIPRRCFGSPSSSKIGRSIHEKSGRKHVHQITLDTYSNRTSHSSRRPSRTHATLGTPASHSPLLEPCWWIVDHIGELRIGHLFLGHGEAPVQVEVAPARRHARESPLHPPLVCASFSIGARDMPIKVTSRLLRWT